MSPKPIRWIHGCAGFVKTFYVISPNLEDCPTICVVVTEIRSDRQKTHRKSKLKENAKASELMIRLQPVFLPHTTAPFLSSTLSVISMHQSSIPLCSWGSHSASSYLVS